MSKFATFKVNEDAIRGTINVSVITPVMSLTKDKSILYNTAKMAIQLTNKYVPMKTGALRDSAHITQTDYSTKVKWGVLGERTYIYAPIQYDTKYKHYTTPGTGPNWIDVLTPNHAEYQQLVDYANDLIRKAVKK